MRAWIRRNAWLPALLLWVNGCDGCDESEADEPSTVASHEEPRASGAEPEPVPAPALRIAMRSSDPDALQPVVSNHDSEAVHLGSTVAIQRATNAGWRTRQDRRAALRLGCDAGAPRCFTLAPGAELHLPAWRARDGRCGCEACTPLEPGRYRLVLRGCRGRYRVFGTPFEIAAP